MFDAIRQHTKSYGTYILVLLLIVIFAVFFGGPMGKCGDHAARFKIATVNGHTIYNQDLNMVYARSYGYERNTKPEVFKQQRAETLRLMLITYLLAEYAEDMDLRVSDQELGDYLKSPLRNREYGYYNRNGHFSGKLYKNYVQNGLGTTPEIYEAFKRNELLAAKYVNLLAMQGAVSGDEIAAEARIKKTKVNLEFVKFNPDDLTSKVSVSDAQIDQFLQKNHNDIDDYYNEHLSEYTTPEQISVRRIYLARPAASDGDDAVDAAKEKWNSVKERILNKNEDFATVAKEVSEDFAKENGGLIEFTAVDNIDQDVAKAVKDAKVGDVKEVVTDSSYMLVKLEGHKDKVVTPLVKVESDIAKTILQDRKVQSLISDLSSQFLAEAKKQKNFKDTLDALKKADIARQKAADKPVSKKRHKVVEEKSYSSIWEDISADTTGDFTQSGKDLSSMFGGQFANIGISGPWDDVPKVGKSADLVKLAFTLTKDQPLIEKTMLIDNSTFLFRLDSRKEPTDDELKDPAIRRQLTASAISPFMLPAKGEFLLYAPLQSYGELIDEAYFSAIDSGKITFFNLKKWEPAQYLVKSRPADATDDIAEVSEDAQKK